VRLAALCGRAVFEPDIPPVTFVRWDGDLETKPLRDAEDCDKPPRCEEIPVTPVFGLDGPSPVAVCVLGLLLCDEMVGSYTPPSSETISVIREDRTLAASPASDCATWELGGASTVAEAGMVSGVP
jgi:hypothetical protein